MYLNSSWRRAAVLVGAIAATAAMFAPPAVAKSSDVATVINCETFRGVGTVTVFTSGVAKGHCSFPTGFPDIGLPNPQKLGHAVHVPCAALAPALAAALHLQVKGTPTGEATLTPSGNANINCRNVVLIPSV